MDAAAAAAPPSPPSTATISTHPTGDAAAAPAPAAGWMKGCPELSWRTTCGRWPRRRPGASAPASPATASLQSVMTASTPTGMREGSDLTDLAAPLTPSAPASLMDGFVARPDLFVKEEMGLGTARFINTKSKRRLLHGRPSSKAKESGEEMWMMPTCLAAMVMHAPVKQAHMQGWPHVSSLVANIIYRISYKLPVHLIQGALGPTCYRGWPCSRAPLSQNRMASCGSWSMSSKREQCNPLHCSVKKVHCAVMIVADVHFLIVYSCVSKCIPEMIFCVM